MKRILLALAVLAGLAGGAGAQTVLPPNTLTPAMAQVGALASGIYVTPTVTASAYTTGTAMGGLLSITPAVRSAVTSGLIQNVRVTSAGGMNGSFDLLLFNANPSSSTVSDHSTVAIAAVDLAKLIGVVHLTDVTALGTPTLIQAAQQAFEFSLAGGTTLYAVLVARGGVTPASTSDITIALSVIQQ